MKVIPALAASLAISVVPATAAEMRELSADRPDQTESPFSVDRGHWQIESSLATRSSGPDGEHGLTLGSLNLKYGLTESIDAQLVFDSYLRGAEGEGFGDTVTLRGKFNVFGNDGGVNALAIMPALTIPARSSGDWAGSLIVPFGHEISDRLYSCVMAQLDYTPESASRWSTFLTGTVSMEINDRFSAYVETAATVPFDGGGTAWQADCGLVIAAGKFSAFDIGCNFGLNDRAPDYEIFVGHTIKF